MVTRIRKVRRLRGSRTHGWGQVGQHRRTGAKGGSGLAGLHKHKWSWTVKYEPDHFGHPVFKPPRRNIVDKWTNVGELDDLYARHFDGGEGKSNSKELRTEETASLNLGRLGFRKLLGKGTVKRSYNVSIPNCSASARLKVEKAGGTITQPRRRDIEQRPGPEKTTPEKRPRATLTEEEGEVAGEKRGKSVKRKGVARTKRELKPRKTNESTPT